MSYYVLPDYWEAGYAVGDDDVGNSPYAPNWEGLVGALIDLKDIIPATVPPGAVGFKAVLFENVVEGEALYVRASDGQVGRACANSSNTVDEATVAGFAKASRSTGQIVNVLTTGIVGGSGLDAGEIYFLSAATPGAITMTAPSSSNSWVVRVGEAATTASLAIQIEPPILLD